MKRMTLTLFCAGLALAAMAQPPEAAGERPVRRGRFGGNPGERPPPPVERYLEQLKEKDPDEYRRLEELRRNDPRALRRELREKVMRRRGGDPRRDGRHPLREEIEAVKTAETPEAREAAKEALRKKIAEMVDRNLERREKRIREIREQLKQLEQRHEQEATRRGELIEYHLRRILEDEIPEPETGPGE